MSIADKTDAEVFRHFAALLRRHAERADTESDAASADGHPDLALAYTQGGIECAAVADDWDDIAAGLDALQEHPDMRTIYWGRVFTQTEWGFWIWAPVRPAWYWLAYRLWKMSWLVWRPFWHGTRLSLSAAWRFSGALVGMTAPVRIEKGT